MPHRYANFTHMLNQIQSGVERELRRFASDFRRPPMSAIPRPFADTIAQYIGRQGKRLRSMLFVLGYRGYSARPVRNLYKSAASLELLHDFILVHDDLIDRASLRRGGAAMHTALDALLNGQRGLRFKGQDLALIVGDMLYALAIHSFLSIKASPLRKQQALELLTKTALYTGCGELDELLHTLRPLADVTPETIYRIYDWKTGHYTFSSPLAMGAILGGARPADVRAFVKIGTELGRAFQIRDDLLDLYGQDNRFGKPALIDLREGKKTLPVWYAYHHCTADERALLERVLECPGAREEELLMVAGIIHRSGAARYATEEMARLVRDAVRKIRKTRMQAKYRDFLIDYAGRLIQPPDVAVAPGPAHADVAETAAVSVAL